MGAVQFILGCVPDFSLSFEVLLPTCVCVGHRYRSTYTIRALSLLATWVLPALSFGALSHIGHWLLSISAAVKREDPKDTTACQFPTRLNVHLRSAAMWCAASCVLQCATSTSRTCFPKSGHRPVGYSRQARSLISLQEASAPSAENCCGACALADTWINASLLPNWFQV